MASYTFDAPPPNAALGVAFGAAYDHHDLLRAQIERIGFLSEEACVWVDSLPPRLRLDFQRGYESVLRSTGIQLKGPVVKYDIPMLRYGSYSLIVELIQTKLTGGLMMSVLSW